ncbi:hypothetical protein EFN91_06590 [Lactococcus lactis]|uniref:Uncharacterized protein n=7 Tax=Lactococcus TaxID=1357 RepID=A0AAJ4T318_LACLL|nr:MULTISPECIES: hypothetical protein [Lactococcus]ARR88258.1 replication initiator protein RepC [Lactococcus lactis subsp. lactis bv. diacetylactis]MCT3101274.1 hypothetical protein [Lactococcus lactis]QRZ36088.1 hypothetical protein LL223_04060 [Lactococcus lactis subsp. lactis]UXV64665.1 hypothetical protein LLUC047_13700 [Lactococcus cremoris]WMF94244.1 hypothetical protein LLJM1_05820 [Lactococcus cremoris]
MAFKTGKNQKHKINDKFGIATFSEKLFCDGVINCVNDGLINKTSRSLANYIVSSEVVRSMQRYELLTNTAETVGKSRIIFGSGDHLGPLQEQNDTSRKLREMVEVVSIAQRINEINGSGEMYAYMATLTRPNTAKGKLKDTFTNARSRVSKLVKSLADGVSRGNGLQLVGGAYLGALASHELTLNKAVLDAGGVHGLYNDHTHLIILADHKLDVNATADVIFDKWQSLNKDFQLARGAFDFREAYTTENDDSELDVVMSAVIESMKYAVKPSTWNQLDKTATSQYQREIFSEVYNSLARAKRKVSYGILYDAKSFLTKFASFDNAMALSMSTKFPDVVTQLVELNRKSGRFESRHVRELTGDEVLYYNRGLIENILVSDEMDADIQDYLDKELSKNTTAGKRRLYFELFKTMDFVKSVDDLLARMDSFVLSLQHKNPKKANDIAILRDAVEQNITYTVDVPSEEPYGMNDVIPPDAIGQGNFKVFPPNTVFVKERRRRDYLRISAESHIEHQKEMMVEFQKHFDKVFDNFDDELKNDEMFFYKIYSKFGLNYLDAKKDKNVNLFVHFDASVSDYFEEII